LYFFLVWRAESEPLSWISS
jgi:hypothetical protein